MTPPLPRLARHLLLPSWRLRLAFPPSVLAVIEQELKSCETRHAGQLRLVVESALPLSALHDDQPARERAIDLFGQLRMWDTAPRNGVLIYLLLADRAVEIVADRGWREHAAGACWQRVCAAMEASLRLGQYQRGMVEGIRAVSDVLARHYPPGASGGGVSPDQVAEP